MNKETKTIRINNEVYQRLVKNAKYTDTMSTVITKLLDKLDFINEQAKSKTHKKK